MRLSKHPRIAGIKEATGDLSRADSILRRAQPGFQLISGDDPTAAELMKRGACGVISVTANIAPRAMHDMCAAALAGQHAQAAAINEKLMPLHLAMFVESNPIPVKWAVARLGLIGAGIRLPLTPLSERLENDVLAAMKAAGVRALSPARRGRPEIKKRPWRGVIGGLAGDGGRVRFAPVRRGGRVVERRWTGISSLHAPKRAYSWVRIPMPTTSASAFTRTATAPDGRAKGTRPHATG